MNMQKRNINMNINKEEEKENYCDSVFDNHSDKYQVQICLMLPKYKD